MTTQRTQMNDLQPIIPTLESFRVGCLWNTWAIPLTVETWRWIDGYRNELGTRHFGAQIGPFFVNMTIRFRA